MKNKILQHTFYVILLNALLMVMSSCLDTSRRGPAITDFAKSGKQYADYDCFDSTVNRYGYSEVYQQAINDNVDLELIYKCTNDGVALISNDGNYDASDYECEDGEYVNEKNLSVCPVKSIPVRPDGQVYISRDFCSCITGKADIRNNCESICTTKPNNDTPTLYVNTTLGADIELNTIFGNLHNWCTVAIGDGQNAPSCSLQLYDRSGGTESLSITTSANSNSFTANLYSIPIGETYVAKLVENTSGASSNSFQILRISQDENQGGTTGLLKIIPVSQYTCMTKTGSTTAGDNYYSDALRLHYYYAYNEKPPTLPPGSHFLICHDAQDQENDSPLLPRLELIPGAFHVWNKSDSRFSVNPDTNKLYINETVSAELLSKYNVENSNTIFGQLSFRNAPNVDVTPIMGYYMIAWIDSNSGLAFCPTEVHYNGNNPMFKVLKEIVGVDTEAVYLAIKEPEVLLDENGEISLNDDGSVVEAPDDIIIIRESLLKQVWFYYDYENKLHLRPNEVTAGQQTIMFYYPTDVDDPYVRKSTQRIYTIKSPDSIGTNIDTSAMQTGLRPSDKRFGCVPITN